ncbi:MAG: BamA/TamA family outer membrane protein [candidate division Zixibacteria bacterium]
MKLPDRERKSNRYTLRKTTFGVLLVLLFLSGANIATGTGFKYSPDADSDSTESFPARIPAHSTWEKIVSVPGYIINFPFKVVLAGVDLVSGVSWDVPFLFELADLMVADDGSRGLIPTYASRSGAGLKLYNKRFPSERSKIDLSATVGLKKRQRYRFRIRNVDLAGGMVTAGLLAQYRLLPDERFYGIGMDSEKGDKSNFTWEQAKVEFTLGKSFGEMLVFDAILFVERNGIFNGKDKEVISTTELFRGVLPGLETEVDFFGAGLKFGYNSLNHPGKPTVGWKAEFAGRIYRLTNINRYGFWESSIDVSRYVHLFYGRSLVLRLAARTTEPFKNKSIPFYYLSDIGRLETLRGFSRARFRDFDNLLGSIEYRYPLMPNYLDAFLFVDIGQVSPDIFNELALDDFETTFGGGVRIWNHEGNILTLQLGKSRERLRAYLSLN